MSPGHKNHHTGTRPIEIGGKSYPLQFTWAAVAALQSELGQDYDQELANAVDTFDTAKLAKIISIGINDELTAAQIMAASPPLVEICRGVMEAITMAYYGPGLKEQKKKRLVAMVPRLDLLKKFFHGGARPDSTQPDSGA